MKKMTNFPAFLLALVVSACATGPAGLLRDQNALGFLDYLARQGSGVHTFEHPLHAWVRKDDLPRLIKLLDSQEPSMSVVLATSSDIRTHSTVGDEAAFMIDGYRAGTYPPALHSAALTKEKKAELRTWWAEARGRE